ncbi:hypothetical protein AGABI2DRAFT_119234 [Agaricus bisporus var. bisporus H97]|uniref:hypothetical protein n=1 Tax=Agaricus bisporus var. bisporus (strain H97 / ATCC MYA-4626 / FGSC 10389) TaxID=936046 RepID=UPI00029F7D08|nr:hypothetical protein AGABI2DRAFT_119234 [Agaricus bisporus var. bisporus H97]EKV45552.1 hypothetical protein AGABI2DRAFT_119234 [Agaricus bisporus var. bisporus H97]
MDRRVRFAVDVSPASTSEASLGPITPPQYTRCLVPTQDASMSMPSFAASLASTANSSASLNKSQFHPALMKPTYDFDVSIHPSNHRSICSNIELQKELNSSMAEIPICHITLQSRHLPWRITISTERYYLTASDVLVGIYNNLRTRASKAEFDMQSRRKQDEISVAFHDRLERRTPPELREQERLKGLRRVDFLPHTALRFGGLEIGKGSDPWVVHFR